MKLGSTIVIAFVIAWTIQFCMTYLQMKRFQKRLNELRKDGMTATGMSGSMYKRRVYGVLVIDKNEKVIHAEQFSGWTVFAGLKPVKELEGLTTKDILDDEMPLPISKKVRNAFQAAVEEIEKAKEKAAEKKDEPSTGLPKINSSGI